MNITGKLLFCATIGGLAAGCAGHEGGGALPPGALPSLESPARASSPVMASAPSASTPLANAGPKGSITVAVSVREKDLVDLTKAYPRLKLRYPKAAGVRSPADTFTSYEIDGELWPSYAGPVPITRDVVVPTSVGSGIVTANATFSNVPLGNNEFVVFTIYGIGAGSNEVFLGNLATTVNVKSASPRVTASVPSTLVFQAKMSMIQAGLFTATDLTSASLTQTTEKEINKLGLQPDPSTGLFSDATLLSLVKAWTPAWGRELAITPNANAQYITIANDATDVAENTLYLNEGSFLAYNDFTGLRPYGAPCNSVVPPHPPSVFPTVNANSCYNSWFVAYGNNAPTIPVYGDALLVGQVNYDVPFTASIKQIATLKKGKTKDLALGAMTPATASINTNDPFDWDQDASPAAERVALPGAVTPSWYSASVGNGDTGFSYYTPAGWSAASPAIEILTWNPWNLPASRFNICSFNNACVATSPSSNTLTIHPPFYDWADDPSYYHWAGNQGTSVASEPASPCTRQSGYQLKFSLNAFSMSTTGTPPAPMWLAPGQPLDFYFYGAPCTTDPNGTTITVTAAGLGGIVYQNSGEAACAGCAIQVIMTSVPKNSPITSVTISGTVPLGSPQDFDLQYIYYPNYYYVSAGKRLPNGPAPRKPQAPLGIELPRS